MQNFLCLRYLHPRHCCVLGWVLGRWWVRFVSVWFAFDLLRFFSTFSPFFYECVRTSTLTREPLPPPRAHGFARRKANLDDLTLSCLFFFLSISSPCPLEYSNRVVPGTSI